MLEHRLGMDLVVVVRSKGELEAVVGQAPEGFGQEPDRFHSDVVFLKAPLTPHEALGGVELRNVWTRCGRGSGS